MFTKDVPRLYGKEASKVILQMDSVSSYVCPCWYSAPPHIANSDKPKGKNAWGLKFSNREKTPWIGKKKSILSATSHLLQETNHRERVCGCPEWSVTGWVMVADADLISPSHCPFQPLRSAARSPLLCSPQSSLFCPHLIKKPAVPWFSAFLSSDLLSPAFSPTFILSSFHLNESIASITSNAEIIMQLLRIEKHAMKTGETEAGELIGQARAIFEQKEISFVVFR